MPDGAKKTSTLPPFNWMDPLLLGEQLNEDERMTSEAAARFCEQELFPGVLEANRNQTFDRAIYKKMGDAGFPRRRPGRLWLPRRHGCDVRRGRPRG